MTWHPKLSSVVSRGIRDAPGRARHDGANASLVRWAQVIGSEVAWMSRPTLSKKLINMPKKAKGRTEKL